ncbi:MAG: hypothetical protein U1E76_08770 [Planctomycetota bacterium]
MFALRNAGTVSTLRRLFGVAHQRAVILAPHGSTRPDWIEQQLAGTPPHWQTWDGFDAWVIDPGDRAQ